ncbi:hypothetical protein CCHR01_19191 [Colletotrichum chrysophilum]|uniref:Uncharacterized protein n=1 Tax=Colletotrichum chrysophilum TaxID=1836956 RepID=A0AAD9EAP0_9PEZI|nr:hypothetical protein CCHR01_19191 [Colletotrichum chrysophilum]
MAHRSSVTGARPKPTFGVIQRRGVAFLAGKEAGVEDMSQKRTNRRTNSSHTTPPPEQTPAAIVQKPEVPAAAVPRGHHHSPDSVPGIWLTFRWWSGPFQLCPRSPVLPVFLEASAAKQDSSLDESDPGIAFQPARPLRRLLRDLAGAVGAARDVTEAKPSARYLQSRLRALMQCPFAALQSFAPIRRQKHRRHLDAEDVIRRGTAVLAERTRTSARKITQPEAPSAASLSTSL